MLEMATPTRTTGSTFLFSALFAISALISGWIYGAAQGARQPVSEVRSDFWGNWMFFGGIERFFNTTIAGLMFSCFGVILGAILGGVIGIFAAQRKYGVWVAVAGALAIPVVTRIAVGGQQDALAGEQVAQMQNASRQYQHDVLQLNARIESFQNAMGDLNYVNSSYVGTSDWGHLHYRSADDPQTVENYYASVLGQQLKTLPSSDPSPDQMHYLTFEHNGLHAQVTVEGTYDGTGGSSIIFILNPQ